MDDGAAGRWQELSQQQKLDENDAGLRDAWLHRFGKALVHTFNHPSSCTYQKAILQNQTITCVQWPAS